IALLDITGAVLDHGVEIGIILDVELENEIQASSGSRIELAFHVIDDVSNGSHGFFLYRMFHRGNGNRCNAGLCNSSEGRVAQGSCQQESYDRLNHAGDGLSTASADPV